MPVLDLLQLRLDVLHLDHRPGLFEGQRGEDDHDEQRQHDNGHPKGRPQVIEPGQGGSDQVEHQAMSWLDGATAADGTGSQPLAPQGLHRAKRRRVSQEPRIAPWPSRASSA